MIRDTVKLISMSFSKSLQCISEQPVAAPDKEEGPAAAIQHHHPAIVQRVQHQDDAERDSAAEIYPSSGSYMFREQGHLITSSHTTILHFRLNMSIVRRETEQFIDTTKSQWEDSKDRTQGKKDEHWSGLDWSRQYKEYSSYYADQLMHQELSHMIETQFPQAIQKIDHWVTFLAANTARRVARYIQEALSGLGVILGVFNLYVGVSNREKIDEMQVQLHHLQKETATNSKNIETLAQAEAFNKYFFEVQNSWQLLKDHLFSVEEVMTNAIHHQLHPSINKLFDMDGIFANMTRHLQTGNYKLAINHTQQLYSLPTDWCGAASGQILDIFVEIPLIDLGESKRMTLYSATSGPFYKNSTLLEMHPMDPMENFVAQSSDGYITSLTQTHLREECTKLGQNYYCHSALLLSKTPMCCLGALFMNELDEASKRCISRVMPQVNMVWPGEKGTFFVFLKEEETLFAKCTTKNGSLHDDMAIIAQKGLNKVVVRDGCSLASIGWKTTLGVPKNSMTMTNITMSNMDFFFLPKAQITQIPLRTPQEIAAYQNKYTSTYDIILIAVASSGAFLAFLALLIMATCLCCHLKNQEPTYNTVNRAEIV